jgi:hypothetical protein
MPSLKALRSSRIVALGLVAVAALIASGADKAADPNAAPPPASVADLEAQGWNPRQVGVVWLFGGVATPGAYTQAELPDLIAAARPARPADHVFVVRRIDGLNFISEPVALKELAGGEGPKLMLVAGDAIVVTKAGTFGATTRPAAERK